MWCWIYNVPDTRLNLSGLRLSLNSVSLASAPWSITALKSSCAQAIEPWHVLGEEVGAGGTARYVDSSVERMQVKVRHMNDNRHVLTCNGRPLPLAGSGTRGEYVAGVRYRAWSPPSGLHPTNRRAGATGLRSGRHLERTFNRWMHVSRHPSRRAQLRYFPGQRQ